MSDHFEKAKDAILKRAAENGGPTTGDLLDAIIATNEDLDANHSETLVLLAEHVKEDKARAAHLAEELATYQKRQADECAEKHRGMVKAEVAEVKQSPRRYTRADLITNFWWLVGGIALVAIVSGITGQIVKLIFR